VFDYSYPYITEVKFVQKLAGTKVRRTASLIKGLRFLAVSHLTVTTVRFTIPEY